jgi:hypothetical protein
LNFSRAITYSANRKFVGIWVLLSTLDTPNHYAAELRSCGRYTVNLETCHRQRFNELSRRHARIDKFS